MAAVVDERNALVHHFLSRWSPESIESTDAALAYLDEQRAKALPLRDRLQALLKSLQETVAAHAAFMASPDFARQMELQWLRDSRLVALFVELAAGTGRPEGWTDVATACHLIREKEPEELKDIAKRYGHKTVKKLLEATGLFDIREEPTPKGGARTLYRTTPGAGCEG